MRYVNLKKKNHSKFEYLAKRMASVSFCCLALASVIVVPLTGKNNDVNAEHEIELVDVLVDEIQVHDIDTLND